jgi:predicted metal-dependent HD superfamily phosphohydrolase
VTAPFDTTALESRWKRWVIEPHRDWTWAMLRTLYGDPRRHYHTLQHVSACLDLLDEAWVRERLRQNQVATESVELALFWHDAVYVPGSPHNERMSADLLVALKPVLVVENPDAITSSVWVAIKETQTHATPTNVAAAVVEIDLSILGTPEATYDAYVRDVRAEYAHVSDAQWRQGRTAFLKGMLERKHIFRWVLERFEEPARANMKRELLAMEGA